MNPEQIWHEYEKNGRLSGKAMLALKGLLRESDDPFDMITLAGDTAAFQLSHEIVPYLNSEDTMVRWNAAGVLFCRFRDVRFAHNCLDLLEHESDTMVRGIVLCGAGELLPLLEDTFLQKELARKLRRVFEDHDEFPEMRDSAYNGIEAAVGIPPLERAPANRLLDLATDAKPEVVAAFCHMYGV